MSARLLFVRRGLPSFSVSFLFSLILFSSLAFSQTIDPAFKPLLQDFGGTQNRADAQASALQPDGKIPVGGQFTAASGSMRTARDTTFRASISDASTGDAEIQADGKIVVRRK